MSVEVMVEQMVPVWRLVKDAIEEGHLVRPDQCEDCGGGGQILGHHDDYSKPLDVRWLCNSCHRKWHNKNEALNKGAKFISQEVPEKPTIFCDVCGHPTESVPGKVQKTRHRPCRDFKNFLAAAVRAVREMDPKPTPAAAREIRHEATVASYRIGALVQPRDSRGRFC